MFKFFRSRRGFTLIELLIVIAIIAILAVLIIVNVSSARVKAQTAKAKDTLSTFKKALLLYQDANSSALPANPSAATAPYWCHPGYSYSGTTCLDELRTQGFIGGFGADILAGPYGKCTSATDDTTVCYSYNTSYLNPARGVMLSVWLNPTDMTGPANVANFPGTPTNNYCDPNNPHIADKQWLWYCDGYSF